MVANPVAHCVSCKKEQEVLHGKEVPVSMTNGQTRLALRGICAVCNRNIFAFTSVKSGKINEGKSSLWRGVISFLRKGE